MPCHYLKLGAKGDPFNRTCQLLSGIMSIVEKIKRLGYIILQMTGNLLHDFQPI